MRKFALVLISLLIVSAASGRSESIYVSPDGSDSNPGTKEQPLKTIAFAIDVQDYDTLILLDGLYRIDQPIQMRRSGTQEKRLIIKALNPRNAIIDAEEYIKEEKSGNSPQRSGIASFHLKGVHHITVEGIEVRNSHGMGISVAHGSTNITLLNCKVVNSYNSGIGLWYCDNVKVFHCEVIGANQIPMKTETDRAGREAPHEALTVAGATNFEVAYNEVHHCDKEGIDVKEVSSHGTVHHNYCHDLPRQGLYVDCWFGLLQDVEFSYNEVHNCEWGMAISGEGKDASMRNIRIHNNTLYDNRGSGIFFGIWGNDVARDSIYIYNNTIIDNGSPDHWAGPVGGIDILSTSLYNTFIYNNICFNNYSYEIGVSLEEAERIKWQKERNIVVTHNHTGIFRSISNPPGSYGSIYGFRGSEPSEGDPLLSPAPAYVPSETSPARRSGWQDAPFTTGSEIGASYELHRKN